LDTKETCDRSITTNLPQENDHQIGTYASGDFLNAIISQLWIHINIAVSTTIKEMMQPMLAELAVPIHFVKLDLGDNSLKTENMFIRRVDALDEEGSGQRKHQGVQIDFDLFWDGHCDILLQATLSKSAKLTFGVQNIKVSGRFSLLLGPLTNDLPIVSAVQYGFANPPDIKLTYAGCVKSLSDKLAFIEGALKSVIDATLAGMLVLPHRMAMGIDLGSYDFLESYKPPDGMLRVGVSSGRGFTILRKMIINDIPDTYCVVSLGASKPFRNTTKYDNLNPQWEAETADFILYDMEQKIYVSVYDEDRGPL
jgi:Ca2+-dependent lipid-binding protein